MGPAFQSFVWKQMGALRIFVLIQVFWAGVFFWLAGMGGALLGERRSWIYILLCVLCALLHVALDPWGVEGQGRMIMRGFTQFVFAAFIWRWLSNFNREGQWAKFFITFFAFLVCCAFFTIGLRFFSHSTFIEVLGVSESDWLLYAIISTAAALLVESKSSRRNSEALLAVGDILDRHRHYLGSLIAAVLCYVAIGAFFAGFDSITWSLLSPLIPMLATIYATYRWFYFSGQTTEFSSALVAQRPELFLGVFFQYLSLLLILSIYFALRRQPNYLRYGLSHLMLFLYWLPSWWLLSQM